MFKLTFDAIDAINAIGHTGMSGTVSVCGRNVKPDENNSGRKSEGRLDGKTTNLMSNNL